MTANQINYFKERENQRAHVMSEAQRSQEIAIAQQNADTNRMNAATNAASVAETARHNAEMERLEAGNYASQATERYSKTQETQRHNIVYEEETSRHNKANESNDLLIAQQNNRARILSSLIGSIQTVANIAKAIG